MRKTYLAGAVSLAAVMAFSMPAMAENAIVWSMSGDALTLDPMAQNEGPTTAVSRQIYEALVGRNVEMTIEPQLATEWRTVDPTTWEFKLRQGVKFHDGADMTAEDVVFSFNRAKEEASDFKSYITTVTEVVAIDDYTVQIKTDGPNPILLSQIGNIVIMDKGWAERNGAIKPQNYKEKEETFAVRNANGTGPFQVELREQDVRTVMVKNANWWGSSVYPTNIDKIELRPIANAATRVAGLLSGEIDVVTSLPVQDIPRVKNTAGLKVEEIAEQRAIFFGMDVAAAELRSSDVKGKNPFADARVREALYLALDVNAIRDKIMNGQSVPAGIITSPGIDGYTEALNARMPMDVAKAKSLLAEAGYPDGFSVRLDCPNDRYVNDEPICQAAVAMFSQIGVKVQLQAQPRSLHFPLVQKDESDFYMLGWGVPTLDSHYVFNFLYKTDGSWNFTNFSDARMDELIEAMAVEMDPAARAAQIAEAWDIAKAANVYLPIHHQGIAWGMKDTLNLAIRPNAEPLFRSATVN